MTVYLIHFNTPYKHARHYIGYTASSKTLPARLEHHRAGTGARLMQVVTNAGIDWEVSRTWDKGDKALERRLKRWHKSRQLCPICRELCEAG